MHHKNKAPDLYRYFVDPPTSRADKERLRLRLRYYNDTKLTNPPLFDRLFQEAVEFFDSTPVTSLSYICFKELATTPPRTPPKTRSHRLNTKAKSSLSFVQANDESSDESEYNDTDLFTSPPPAATLKKEKNNSTTIMTVGNGVTVTPFHKEERHPKGLLEVDYIGVKYRASSLVDVFQKKIKHTVGKEGLSLDIEVPKFDGETTQNLLAHFRRTADGEESDVLNSVLEAMSDKVGAPYVKALLMQITTASDNNDDFEKIHVPFNRKVIPDSMVLHKLPVSVTAETGKYDSHNNPKTYSYKVVDYVFVFKVLNGERFIKRYAAYNEDDLADAFDDLDVEEDESYG